MRHPYALPSLTLEMGHRYSHDAPVTICTVGVRPTHDCVVANA